MAFGLVFNINNKIQIIIVLIETLFILSQNATEWQYRINVLLFASSDIFAMFNQFILMLIDPIIIVDNDDLLMALTFGFSINTIQLLYYPDETEIVH